MIEGSWQESINLNFISFNIHHQDLLGILQTVRFELMLPNYIHIYIYA